MTKKIRQPKEPYQPAKESKAHDAPKQNVIEEHGWIYSPKFLLLIFFFAVALYANTLDYHYTLDDPISTANNKYVAMGVEGIPTLFTKGYMYGLNGINQGAYRPMPLISFAIEYEFMGENPPVNHWINVILYGLSSVVLFLVLKKLFRNRHFIFALAITLLYVAHPVHTEVVASIKSRDEILALLFLLFSLQTLLVYDERKNPLWLALSGLMFYCSLISKESAFTFLAVIPFTLYFFREYSLKQIILISVPFALAGGLYLFQRSVFLESVVSSKNLDVINNTLYAADNSADKLATAFYILSKYVWLLVFPMELSWDYSYNQIPIIGFGSFKAIWAVLLYAGMGAYILYGLKRKDIVAYCFLFFISTISVVSNIFVDFGSTMGERFLFVPSLAFCILLAWGVFRILKIDEFIKNLRPSTGLIGIFTVILLLYSVRTISRNVVWKNNMNLFTSGVESAPNSARTNFCLGYEYFVYGDKETEPTIKDNWYRKAAEQMLVAVRIYPKYVDAHKNIGFMYYKLKDWNNAVRFLNNSIILNDSLPDANFYIALSYGYKGVYDSAYMYFDNALRLKPDYVEAWHYKGVIYSEQADKDPARKAEHVNNAVAAFDKALSMDPKYYESYIQKGYTLGKINQFDQATVELKKGIALKPDLHEAVMFIGIAYGFQNKYDSAITYFKKAIGVKPGYADAYRNLGITYKNIKDYDNAIKYFSEGIQANPGDQGLQVLLNETTALKNSGK